MSMIQIRDATENDMEQILSIYNHVILHTTAVYEYLPHTLQMRLKWFESRTHQGFPVFVAEENEAIMGFASFGFFREKEAYKYSVENSVYVKESARGRGISKMLLASLIARAKEMKLHTMIAAIDATNEISIRLHKQFGFTETAYLKEVGFKFNRWLNLLFMQLILE